jgi:glycosyltransferase involved in cell wall biosynthesis
MSTHFLVGQICPAPTEADALSTKTKVLLLNHTGIVSGAERVLLLILDNLNGDFFDPVVICPKGSELAELVRRKGVPVTDLPNLTARFTWNPLKLFQYLLSYASVIRELRNTLRRENVDLIHANSVRAGLLATFATAGTGTPVIWHLHDIMKRHPFSTAIRWVVTIIPPVLTLSDSRAAADRFRGLLLRLTGNRTRIEVMYNPVDSEVFYPDVNQRKLTRKQLGLLDEQFAFAIIGQLTPRKGQLETIEAFSSVARDLPHVVLFIVGAPLFEHDQEYLEKLKSAVARLTLKDRVIFLGQHSDVNALLSGIDGVVINSRREPFCLIALEALAAEKPVVAACVDGIPELIKDKATGLLTPPGDRQALALALRKLCGDPDLCRKLSSDGRAMVERNFSCSQYIQTLESLYHEAAKSVNSNSPSLATNA